MLADIARNTHAALASPRAIEECRATRGLPRVARGHRGRPLSRSRKPLRTCRGPPPDGELWRNALGAGGENGRRCPRRRVGTATVHAGNEPWWDGELDRAPGVRRRAGDAL